MPAYLQELVMDSSPLVLNPEHLCSFSFCHRHKRGKG
jgi:hypothetical protein